MTTPADWQKLVDRTRRLRELLEEALQLDATIDTGLKYSGAGFLENVNNIDFAIQDMKGFEICRADPSAYLWWMKRVDRLEGLDEIYSEFVEYPAEFQLFLAFDHRFCDRYPDLAVRIASEAHTKAGPLLGPTDELRNAVEAALADMLADD